MAIDLAPGTTGAQRAALVSRIVSANPDGTPGGSYELPQPRTVAFVRSAHRADGRPAALRSLLGLAVAAVLSLALTLLSLGHNAGCRQRFLALLKTLGMTRSQIRAVIAWQITLTLLIAVAVGGALGIIGRPCWPGTPLSPAGSGVVPIVEVPAFALVLGLVALVLAWLNLLAALPLYEAALTRPGVGACGPSKPGTSPRPSWRSPRR